MTAAKNAIVSWLLEFRIRMFVKRAVTLSLEQQGIKFHYLATKQGLFLDGNLDQGVIMEKSPLS